MYLESHLCAGVDVGTSTPATPAVKQSQQFNFVVVVVVVAAVRWLLLLLPSATCCCVLNVCAERAVIIAVVVVAFHRPWGSHGHVSSSTFRVMGWHSSSEHNFLLVNSAKKKNVCI